MKCTVCGSNEFILVSTIVVTDQFKIFKNGRVSDHYIIRNIDRVDMADNDNTIRCNNCDTDYVLVGKGREVLINMDYSQVNLERDALKL